MRYVQQPCKICKHYLERMSECRNCETWKWCKNISEAALNALLEDK